MSVNFAEVALAALTVLGAVTLVSVFAVGLSGVRTTGELSVLLAALVLLGVLLVGPFRRVGI